MQVWRGAACAAMLCACCNPPMERNAQFLASELQNPTDTGCDVGPPALGFGEAFELPRADFKLVCASWRRANAPRTLTNSFTVDVSAYTPRQSLISRVQLVDVDIPNTQLLIEDAWSRLYFDLGQRVGSSCRAVTLSAQGVTGTVAATVQLPLPVDAVLGFEALPDGWARVYTHAQAPYPLPVIAGAYATFPSSYLFVVWVSVSAGVGTTHRLNLTAGNTRPGPSINTFDVQDASLYAALTSAAQVAPAFLCASVIPDPTGLAALLSAALGNALNAACSAADYY